MFAASGGKCNPKRVNTLAYLHFHVAVPAVLARRAAVVEAHGRALDELAREHGLALWQAFAAFFAGWCRAQRGEAGAVAAMARGLAETRATGARLTLPLLLAEVAKVAAARGRAGEAEALLDEGVQELAATGQRCFEPELYRVRGELLLRGPPDRRAAGEGWLGRALAVAREQSARSWELRTATSLAHAWAARGERRKAQDLVAAAYGWFTEGFDTPDLRDARALLDQLE